jgi:hypothetical protein
VWNEGRISVGELWGYYTRYPYLPRLRDRSVLVARLTDVLSEIAYVERGFALASGYVKATGNFVDLAVPLEELSFGPVLDTTLLVRPDLALAQRRRERDAAEAERKRLEDEEAERRRREGDGDPDPGPGPDPKPPKPQPARPIVPNGRYEGRWELDPEADPAAIGARLRAIGDEVVRHLAAAEGVDLLEVSFEVNVETNVGFDERVRRTVSENAGNLRFDTSEFTDIEL